LGAGLIAFAGATLERGIDIVMETCGFTDKLKGTDLVLTGEGNTDSQTAYGKVPAGIASLAKKESVPVICISGSLSPGYDDIYDAGITAVFSVTQGPVLLEDAIRNAAENLVNTTYNVIKAFTA
jgi:glycerate kinase